MAEPDDTEIRNDESSENEAALPSQCCTACGSNVVGSGKFCAECGAPINAPIEEPVGAKESAPTDAPGEDAAVEKPTSSTSTKRRLLLIAALLLLVAAIAGGVIYKNHQDAVDKRERAAKAQKVAAAKAAEERRRHEETIATNLACHTMLEPLITAEHELSGRLDIGMNFAAYGEGVGSVSVAYTALDIDAIGEDPSCLSDIAVPAENAFNQYRAAYNVWNKCMESLSCDNDSITKTLQKHWARAGTNTTKAKTALDALEIA